MKRMGNVTAKKGTIILDLDLEEEMTAHMALPKPLRDFIDFEAANRWSAADLLQQCRDAGEDIQKVWPHVLRFLRAKEAEITMAVHGAGHPQAGRAAAPLQRAR